MDRLDRQDVKQLLGDALLDQAIVHVQDHARIAAAYYGELVEGGMDSDDAMDLTRDWHSIYWTTFFTNHYINQRTKE
jgi:hypothetical protein